jgi:hypothetical protein
MLINGYIEIDKAIKINHRIKRPLIIWLSISLAVELIYFLLDDI